MKQLKRTILTLVALLALTAQAWADEQSESFTTATSGQTTYTGEHFTITGQYANEDGLWITGQNGSQENAANTVTISSKNGENITRIEAVIGYIDSGCALASTSGNVTGTYASEQTITISSVNATTVTLSSTTNDGKLLAFKTWTIYYGSAAPTNVNWDATTKTGTFTQPGSDVVLTPIYAPVAQWATESDVELLPTAAEGVFAGTTDPIIVEGTVAPGQGTVMYAVTSTNQATAPELSAFSATVPTAENIADEGADVLVWYYIQGADAPDGQEATAENTFNDSEICATPLEVSVLSNKFDITFNAANANTIESGKATVTVGGTAATVTEGKLEGVKMGSEVKMTAKQGYKFRKVEAKKVKPAKAVAEATAEDKGKVIGTDGNIYADVEAATAAGTTAVAMIVYIGTTGHGLALALTDEGQMAWEAAMTACNTTKNTDTPVTGATWQLASNTQWGYMKGASGAGSWDALKNGFSSVGGTNLQSAGYWSSTESVSGTAFYYDFYNNDNYTAGKGNGSIWVRACLAW